MDSLDPLCNLCSHRLVFPARVFEHPRLQHVPICAICFEKEDHEVDVDDDDDEDDICYWCNERDCGDILLCDTCEKGFCTHCITSYLGEDTLQAILKTDPWSCFACDPSALATLTSHLTSNEQIEYFPADVNETRKLLVDVENEVSCLLAVSI